MTAGAASSGARAWLAARGISWLTPRRLRWLTIGLVVVGLALSSTISGSTKRGQLPSPNGASQAAHR